MTKSISKNLRIFFWLKKKDPSHSKLQQLHSQCQPKNVTIASFWQTQLMNIANESNIEK